MTVPGWRQDRCEATRHWPEVPALNILASSLVSKLETNRLEVFDVSQFMSTGWTKKKGGLNKHGHNYCEIHQKGKKLVCFGKFSLNAAG